MIVLSSGKQALVDLVDSSRSFNYRICLSKKNITSVCGPEQKDAFSYMKEKLTSAPILQFPDFSVSFLQSDASYRVLGLSVVVA